MSQRQMAYVIVRNDEDMFVAVARADVAAVEFQRSRGLMNSTRVITIEMIEESTPPRRRRMPGSRCADCGKIGEITGHMDCQYPHNH